MFPAPVFLYADGLVGRRANGKIPRNFGTGTSSFDPCLGQSQVRPISQGYWPPYLPDLTLEEVAMEIPSQSAITADNVTLDIDGVLYIRVFDAYKARCQLQYHLH
jgi:hypothetical protein